jgi:hypothetical protein
MRGFPIGEAHGSRLPRCWCCDTLVSTQRDNPVHCDICGVELHREPHVQPRGRSVGGAASLATQEIASTPAWSARNGPPYWDMLSFFLEHGE